METMQPTLKSGRNTWDRINMPIEEFQARVKKIKKGMKKEGIDVLLLYGHAFNEYGNYCYLSNYVIRLPQGAIVAIPSKGELALLFEGAARGVSSVKKMTWITDVRASSDVSKECVNYIKEKNFTPSVIGVAGLNRLMPNHQWQFLRDSLPEWRIEDADNLLQELRIVKSPLEIMQIRRSARIIGATFDFIAQTSFANPSEKLLEAAMRREARLEGAEDFRMMIAKPSEKRWSFKPPETIPILPDEVVMISLSVEFERYWAEAVRTFAFRGSSFVETQSEDMKILYAGIIGGFTAGKKASQFYLESIEKVTVSKFEYISDYGLGQGVGLSPQEYPILAEGDHSTLREGMVSSLRVGIYDKERGATMNGETVYISKKGCEILTR